MIDELRVGNSIVVGEITLVPIEHYSINSGDSGAGGWASGKKDAFAVVVCDASGARAFDVCAEELPIDPLVEKVSDLGKILDEISDVS